MYDTHLPDPDRQAEFYESVPAKRAMAWVIDTVAIALLTTLIAAVTLVGLFFWLPIFAFVNFIYRWASLANGSATPGMRLMSIEFRNAKGLELSSAEAFLHTLGYFISMSTAVIQVVSVILMMTGARGQGLSDLVLGTVALNRRA